MTQEERSSLISEKVELTLKIKASDIINPKDMRRLDQINSLLMSDGQSEDLRFTAKKVRQSNRVTSFTRDRR